MWRKPPHTTLVVMDAIKTIKRILRGPRQRVDEPERPSQAWLARVERRLDEGDVLTADELGRLREVLTEPERAA